MAKTATLKDVLYALEFMGAELCRWPASNPASEPTWKIEPSGLKVPARIAEEARKHNIVRVDGTGFWIERYRWRAVA